MTTPFSVRHAEAAIFHRCAGDTQALVERRGRHRGAFFLRRRLLPERDLVGGPAGHEPDLHPLPIGVELVGEDLWQRGVGPLPDLRLRQAERDLPAGGDQDPIRDLIVGGVIALRARRPPCDRHKQGCGGQRRSGEDKTARHWRHQNSSERSPQCPARLRKRGRTPGRMPPSHCIDKTFSDSAADRMHASPARRRSPVILGKQTHVAKAQQSIGRTMVLCNRGSTQQEPVQRKTRRGVPPGYVAWF